MRKCAIGFTWFLVFYGMVGWFGGFGFPNLPHSVSSYGLSQESSQVTSTLTPPGMQASVGIGMMVLVTTAALSAIGTLTGCLPGTSDFTPNRRRRWGDR